MQHTRILILLALCSTLLIWVLQPPFTPTQATAVSGYVYGWGNNVQGQTDIPPALTAVKAVSARGLPSLALKSDGTVVAWGVPGTSSGLEDVPLGLIGVKAIATGGQYLALKSDGTVTAWGSYWAGQPMPSGLNSVKAIAVGSNWSLALKTDGTVTAWGDNSIGQIDIPPGLSDVKAISAGSSHSLALKSDGTVTAWGDNRFGQTDVPIDLTAVKAISAGGAHSLALKTDGTVIAWGDNRWGQTAVPTGLTTVKAISAGEYHSLALKTNGTVVAWGWNGYGVSQIPAGLTGVQAISAGVMHNLVITTAKYATRTPTKTRRPTRVTSTPTPPSQGGGTVEETPSKTPTHTRTPTMTPSRTPALPSPVSGQEIRNPSFETGARNWTTRTDSSALLIQRIPAMARTGSGLAVFGDAASATQSLAQFVYVPRSKPTLVFWYKVRSSERCGRFSDRSRILVHKTVVWNLDVCTYQVSPVWQKIEIDLRPYAGTYVMLTLAMQTNSTINSTWFVDDLSWR